VTADAFIIGSASLFSLGNLCPPLLLQSRPVVVVVVVVGKKPKRTASLFVFVLGIGPDGNNRESTEMQTSFPLSNQNSWRWESEHYLCRVKDKRGGR